MKKRARRTALTGTSSKPFTREQVAQLHTLLEPIIDRLTMLEAQSDELRAIGEKTLNALNVKRGFGIVEDPGPEAARAEHDTEFRKAIESQPCPFCGGPMVKRARKADKRWFMGCAKYPDCTGSRPYAHPGDVAAGEDHERQFDFEGGGGPGPIDSDDIPF